MKRFLFAASFTLATAASGFAAKSAWAVDPTFAENWEADSAANYWCSAFTDTYSRDACVTGTNLIVRDSATDMAPSCAGKYEREVTQRSGGRVFMKTPIPVTPGNSYCVTAWLRRATNASNYPYLGLNITNAMGVPTPPGTVPGLSTLSETWLMGEPGFTNPDASGVAGLTQVGTWQFLARTYTAPALVTNVILKVETFCGMGGCTGNGGDGDFDDIRWYPGACAAMQAPAATESSHEVCAGTKPFCTSQQRSVTVNGMTSMTPVFSCIPCASNFGGASAPSCLTTAPICVTGGANQGACTSTCDADFGAAAGNAKCPTSGASVCKAGTCGTCTQNSECTTGSNHTGSTCIGGVCTSACTIPTESTACLAGQYCNAVNMTTSGVCTPKVANGSPLPSDMPISGMCTPANATRVCASGTCETTDNRCGLLPSSACTATAACRASVCFTDGKCGLPNGETCTTGPSCRALVCDVSDNKCGRVDGSACTAAGECRSAVCNNGVCGTGGGTAGSSGTAGTTGGDGGTPAAGVVNGAGIEGGGFSCSLDATNGGSGAGVLALVTAAALALGTRRRRG